MNMFFSVLSDFVNDPMRGYLPRGFRKPFRLGMIIALALALILCLPVLFYPYLDREMRNPAIMTLAIVLLEIILPLLFLIVYAEVRILRRKINAKRE